MKQKEVLTIPNFLSVARLPLALLVPLFTESPIRFLLLAGVIFLDFFDGYVARKLNQTSKLGAILDPLFDRLCVLFLFLFFFLELNLPLYALFLFFLRDIVSVSASLFIFLKKLHKKIELKARLWGKIVTALQFFTLVFMTAYANTLVWISLYLITFFSIIAIIDYIIYAKKRLKK